MTFVPVAKFHILIQSRILVKSNRKSIFLSSDLLCWSSQGKITYVKNLLGRNQKIKLEKAVIGQMSLWIHRITDSYEERKIYVEIPVQS